MIYPWFGAVRMYGYGYGQTRQSRWRIFHSDQLLHLHLYHAE